MPSFNMKITFLLICFLLIWLPLIEMNVGILPTIENHEKRDLVKPTTATANIANWIETYTRYFNDNFGGRRHLIFANSFLQAKLFNRAAVPQVIIGKSGWLYYKPEAIGDGTGFDDFAGKVPFSNTELAQLTTDILAVKKQATIMGTPLKIIIAPNKNTIYPEYVPERLAVKQGLTRYDQIIQSLSLEDEGIIMDVRNTLIEGKQIAPTYYKTDTHWNNHGAYRVYRQLTQELGNNHDKTPNLELARVTFNPKTNGDLSTMLSLPGIFKDEEVMTNINIQTSRKVDKELNTPSPTETYRSPQSSKGTLLFFGDSYSRQLIPYLSSYFSESIFVFIGPTYKIDVALINQVKPNLVIWQVAERFSHYLIQTR
jgi:hypothetical protein